jgi:hypothetical protein
MIGSTCAAVPAIINRTTRRLADQRGSVTAELAAAMPAFVLLLVVGLSAVTAAGTQIRCVAAARDAAVTAARGGDGQAAGTRAAPDGARIVVTSGAEQARAVVTADIRPLGGRLPGLRVSASAVAAAEPGSM